MQGPSYSLQHLFRQAPECFVSGRLPHNILAFLSLAAGYAQRQLDRFLSRRDAAYNSVCNFYFLGRLRPEPISDREIIRLLRGA